MNIIEVENLSKKYIIGHDKGADGSFKYKSFRETITHSVRGLGQRIIHPLSPNKETTSLEEFWALKDINFKIEEGDKVGIIGRNGAGKSTLLKILSRITEPTTGKITMRGRVASLLEVGTGFHPELTGRENIYLNGTILGMRHKEIKKKFDDIVDFSGVEKFLDTPVKRYSSGMYVRLAFAVAAHLDPEILLVDEVLAVGDAEFQKKCLGKMDEVSKQGRTILFVSHNMEAVERLCNKCIYLSLGAISQYEKSVTSVISSYLSPSNSDNKHVWENNGVEFQNNYFIPLKLYLSDSLAVPITPPVSNSDEFFFAIEGEIREINNLLEIGIAIFDENNKPVFVSQLTDKNQKYWPKLNIGRNKILVKIPRHFLNEGEYRVDLYSCLYLTTFLFEFNKNCPIIFFRIQGGLSESPYWYRKRSGILAPILDWSLF